MRTVLLIRHGEVEDAAHCFHWPDRCADERGRRGQIRVLAQRLERVRLDAVYCSDLDRSRLTAKLLAEGRAIPVHVQPELREIDLGAWEGLSRREVAERRPAEYERRGRDIENSGRQAGKASATSRRVCSAFGRALSGEAGPAPSPSPPMPGSIA